MTKGGEINASNNQAAEEEVGRVREIGLGLGDAERRRDTGRRAVSGADLLRAKLPRFSGQESGALDIIRRAASTGSIAVFFSGGKDSTVLLDLVRRVVPDAPAVFIDSGAELRSTLALVAHYGAETVHPEMTITECARICGWWGYRNPSIPGGRVDLKAMLITDPADRWHNANGHTVSAIGLRGEESLAREMSASKHGPLYRMKSGRMRLCPLLSWGVDDIWAYIAHYRLPYNPAYDAMAEMGIAREDQRVGTCLGDTNFSRGRLAYIKQCEPDTFNLLAAEFPSMRAYA